MKGYIKIECTENEDKTRGQIEIESNMEGSREDCFRIINELWSEVFRMNDGDFMMFMIWRKMVKERETADCIKVDLSAMKRGETE